VGEGRSVDRVETRYARCGDAQLAYKVMGDGPALVSVNGTIPWVAAIADPLVASYWDRIARFSRHVMYDPRGSGQSDPLPPGIAPTVDDQVEDLRGVLDDAGIERVFLSGFHAGGGASIAFAVRYPERTAGLFIVNGWARMIRGDGYPYGMTPEFSERLIASHGERIGTGMFAEAFSPSRIGDSEVKALYIRIDGGHTRSQAMLLTQMAQTFDVRDLLAEVAVPTVVMHNRENRAIPAEHGRFLAAQIPGARFIEFEGTDHFFVLENPDPVLIELEAFVTGNRPVAQPDRTFASVMFADLVESTHRAAQVGDRRWRELVDRYERAVVERTEAHGGRVVKTTGDGVLAVFPLPSRAVRCASALVRVSADIELQSRIGIHAGEIETRGDDVLGLAVHIGARTCAMAGAGEVLLTQTMRDLLLGSGFDLVERGVHELRGVPGSWQLFALRDGLTDEDDRTITPL
jgi:class 3 adenylate cyclase/pimeloyl-ACP methyl ester carboxylesterase